MNLKITLVVAASVIGNVTTIPYIIDVFRQKTTPHSYSWLVWTILQVTGALAMLAGGAGIGVLYLFIGAATCIFVFLLSLRYGTKNITSFDMVCLVGALLATAVWFFLHDALLSVILVASIDLVAFLPTFRKAYEEPRTETLSMYIFSGIAQLMSLVSLSVFTFTTTFYLSELVVANAVFVAMVLIRRAHTPAPSSSSLLK